MLSYPLLRFFTAPCAAVGNSRSGMLDISLRCGGDKRENSVSDHASDILAQGKCHDGHCANRRTWSLRVVPQRQTSGKRADQAAVVSGHNKTLYWQEFDVSKLLRRGENVWGVMLGNSFWHVGPANDSLRYVKTDAMPDFSSGYPYLLWLEARIRTKDGKEQVIASSDSWKWIEGPLTFSHIYAGEDYDARLLPTGWNSPGFNDREWKPVLTTPAPSATLEQYRARRWNRLKSSSP